MPNNPISEHTGLPYDPAWGYQPHGKRRPSDNPLLNRPINPKLQMTVQKGQEKSSDPALIDRDEVPSLWSMLSRLFRRKAVRILDCAVLPIGEGVQFIAIDVKYKGKQYQGILHPAKGEKEYTNA